MGYVRWNGERDANTLEPMRVFTAPCYHCGMQTNTPMDCVHDAEVKMWRERFEKLLSSLNEVVKKCRLVHGDDPMRADMMRWLEDLRDKKPWETCGEEWKDK